MDALQLKNYFSGFAIKCPDDPGTCKHFNRHSVRSPCWRTILPLVGVGRNAVP